MRLEAEDVGVVQHSKVRFHPIQNTFDPTALKGARRGTGAGRAAVGRPGPQMARSTIPAMPALPSLSFLSEETAAELAAQERRSELDCKSGVLPSFSGVIVPLTISNFTAGLHELGRPLPRWPHCAPAPP